MTALDPALEQLKDSLMDLACRATGFRRDAFRVGAIEKMVRERSSSSASLEALAQDAASGSPDLVSRLAEAVPVGETYFFREPEHLRFLEEKMLPALAGGGLRAWSAGCATGEEAYSLSACLHAAGAGSPEILGTDLSQQHLQTAQRGSYQSWSLRGSGELYPLFENAGGPVLQVRRELKESVRFLNHNLLDPLPPEEGLFDVIFCRNVLIYFTPEAARRALENLAGALAVDGLLFLGPADLPFSPPGFKSHGPAELSIYRKVQLPKLKSHTPPKALKSLKAAPPPRKKENPKVERVAGKSAAVSLHLRVLETMEKEEQAESGRLLNLLCRDYPDYLPGLYEAALWNGRHKKRSLAENLMREVLGKLKGKNRSKTIPGPQSLTAGFYKVSAEAFLARKEKE